MGYPKLDFCTGFQNIFLVSIKYTYFCHSYFLSTAAYKKFTLIVQRSDVNLLPRHKSLFRIFRNDEVKTTLSEKEKPKFRHALVLGSLALILATFLSTRYSWNITALLAWQMLKLSGVESTYDPLSSQITVQLLDGTVTSFNISIEFSGLVTVAIFAVISTFTVGLLRGSILTKLGWFLLGTGVGILWNVNRLALVIAVAYNFGMSAFSFIHYLVGPAIDFIWIVSMWALGMSWLKKGGTPP